MPVILHVEDERAIRLLYKEVFEERGYKIVQACTGEEALQMLKSTSPDLIILDLKMPGMGGTGFLQEFRLLERDIPVVISSAYPYAPESHAADAYVLKSGDIEILVRKVQGMLRRTRNN